MISVVVYGRNDSYGYNLHKRAAISLNCISEILAFPSDEMLFVDYNTPDDLPTFPEAIQDTLTAKARDKLRILRVRPHIHDRVKARTHLCAIEPLARNVGVRRSNPNNRWILSTNTDIVFVLQSKASLDDVVGDLPGGIYHAPRLEIPETLWEGLDRNDPVNIINLFRTWGRSLHLDEIVQGRPSTLYDGPGDCQLMEREALHAVAAFDEEMLLGWHVDSNIARRLQLYYGAISDLGSEVFAYHCDHTRCVTPAHSAERKQNDPKRFYEGLADPVLATQFDRWGCAGDKIEEIRLSGRSFTGYVSALSSAIGAALQTPYRSYYSHDTFDKADYDPRHVLPFLVDLFSSASRSTKVAWFGCRQQTLDRFSSAWQDLGFNFPILVDNQGVSDRIFVSNERTVSIHVDGAFDTADSFIFDFGCAEEARDGSLDHRQRQALSSRLLQAVTAEHNRILVGAPMRRFVGINAINTTFEAFFCSYIAASATPYSTRLRHGFVFPPTKGIKDWLPAMHAGPAGRRVGNVIESVGDLADCVMYGPYRSLLPGQYRLVIALDSSRKLDSSAQRSKEIWAALEVISGDKVVAIAFLAPKDFGGVEYEVFFDVPQELAFDCSCSFEARLKTVIPIPFMVTRLGVERIEGAPITETLRPIISLLSNIAPALSVGPAGVRLPGGIGLREEDGAPLSGTLAYGPYWYLPQGDYLATFTIEIGRPVRKTKAVGTLFTIEVASRDRLLARSEVAGSQDRRTEFKVPFSVRRVADDRLAIEFRVWSSGLVPLRLSKLSVNRVEEQPWDWLQAMQAGEVGRRIGGSIRSLGGKAGCVMYGPYRSLFSGSYRLVWRIEGASRWSAFSSRPNSVRAVLEVVSGNNVVGVLLLTAKDLDGSEGEFRFDVPEGFGADACCSFEARLRTVLPTRLTVSKLAVGPVEGSEVVRTPRPIMSLLPDLLPVLSLGPVGKRGEESIHAVQNKPGHLNGGPYWNLPEGNYLARFTIDAGRFPESLDPTRVGFSLEVVSGAFLLGRMEVHAGDIESGIFDVPFSVRKPDGGDLAIELRIWSSGLVPLRLSRLKVDLLDGESLWQESTPAVESMSRWRRSC